MWVSGKLASRKLQPISTAERLQRTVLILAENFKEPEDCCIFLKYFDHLREDLLDQSSEILTRKLVNNDVKHMHIDMALAQLSEIAEHRIIEYLDQENEHEYPEY